MKKAALLTLMALFAFSASSAWPPAAWADEVRPDDQVVFDLSTEGWVTTKTALVSLSVEAAVTAQGSEGSLRAAMQNAVTGVARGDWRLTSFNRMQDQTGLERWSAAYEARLPEEDLSGIQDKVKRVSKPGMQIRVINIAFNPTLEETETEQAALRTNLYKKANEQLASLNAALPGRNFRIGLIDFTNQAVMRPQRQYMAINKAMAEDSVAPSTGVGSLERAQKLTLKAHVVMMATPPAAGK